MTKDKIEEEICPVCGCYCLGKGGIGCIDKKGMYERERKQVKIPLVKCPSCGRKEFVVSIFGSICRKCFYTE